MSPGKDIVVILDSGSSSSTLQAFSKVDLNIYENNLRAETLKLERGEMGEAGCSDRSAAIKSHAAAMAKSVDKDIGVAAARDLIAALRSPHPASPISPLSDFKVSALKLLA